MMPDSLGSVPEGLAESYLILWDGQCNFCKRSVDWLMKRTPESVVALPYQQQSAWLPPEILEDCQNQFYLRTPEGQFLAGGDALILLFNLIGWKTFSRILEIPGLTQLTRLAYRFVARNRSLISRFIFKQK